MPETYSLAVTGARADSLPNMVKNNTLPDSAARAGSVQQAEMLNSQILCKQPDGSFAYFTIDAERSTANNVVLKAVSP